MDDFYAAIGYGDINSNQIAQTIFNQEQREQEGLAGLSGTLLQTRFSRSTSKVADGLMMQGVEGLRTRLGHCCTPIPGDPIIGYVTKAHGVTIHRTDCPNIATCIKRGHNHRLIDVQWTEGDQKTYPVRIQISAYDRSGLMRDISKLIADEHINMLSVEVLTGQKDNLALINAALGIEDVTQLMRLLTKIDRLPNIIDVRRTLS